MPDFHLPVWEDWKRDVKLFFPDVDLLGTISDSNPYHFYIVFKVGIFLNNTIKPINYRRGLQAVRSEYAQNLYQYELPGSVRWLEGSRTFQAKVFFVFL